MEVGINLGALSDPDNPQFRNELDKAPKTLTSKGSRSFYKAVLPVLASTENAELGKDILLSLCKILQTRAFVASFVNGKYVKYLPFEKEQFQEQILDLLCFLCKLNPNALDPSISSEFAILTEKFPAKCLTLVAILSSNFTSIQDPWGIYGVIVKQPQYFNTEDLLPNYVTLLISMIRDYENFRIAYANKTWRALCHLLSNASLENQKVIYYGLCTLYDIQPKVVEKGSFPVSDVTKSLKNQETRSAALALLLRHQPNKFTEGIPSLIHLLLKIGREDKKATLVLMEMGMNEEMAAIMVQRPKWFSIGLPSTIDTVKLFAIVLLHKQLRPKIMEGAEHVIVLFQNMVDQDDPPICSIICTFIRRLPIDRHFVTALGKNGFLRKYIDLFMSSDDPNLYISGLLFFSTISSYAYHRDYEYLIDAIAKLLKREETAKTSATVAAQLARFSKLAPTFKKLKIDQFFKRKLDDPVFQKHAKKFLQCESYKDDQ